MSVTPEVLRNLGITLWLRRDPAPEAVPASVSAVIPADAQAPPPRPEPALAAAPAVPETPEAPAWTYDEVPLAEPPPYLDFDPAQEWEPPEPEIEPPLDWDALRQRVAECRRCVLHQGRTHSVFGVGDQRARLMLVGEGPGEQEDLQGEPFVGRAGQLLNAMLAAIGLQREQVYIANVIKCRPPSNRNPAPEEMRQCGGYLQRQIELVQPQLLVAVGAVAAQYLLQTDTPIGKLRGVLHQYRDLPLRVTYHPAYLLRAPAEKRKSWEDLQSIRDFLTTTVPR